MSTKPIQEQFGEKVIEAFVEFARADLKTPQELAKDEFAHVSDLALRSVLSAAYYGSRWIYKLGLALLTKDEERAAHVRAQLVDYASITEGLLGHCIAHAVRGKHQVGSLYQWSNPRTLKGPLDWSKGTPEFILSRQTFWWIIRISTSFGIIHPGLETDLHWLREQRNSVHLRRRASIGQTAYLNHSKRAFEITTTTIHQSKAWKQNHP